MAAKNRAKSHKYRISVRVRPISIKPRFKEINIGLLFASSFQINRGEEGELLEKKPDMLYYFI